MQKEIARRRFDAVRERFDALLRRGPSRSALGGAAKSPPEHSSIDPEDDDRACLLFFVPFVAEMGISSPGHVLLAYLRRLRTGRGDTALLSKLEPFCSYPASADSPLTSFPAGRKLSMI